MSEKDRKTRQHRITEGYKPLKKGYKPQGGDVTGGHKPEKSELKPKHPPKKR